MAVPKTLAEALLLLPDNSTGLISEQDMRDIVTFLDNQVGSPFPHAIGRLYGFWNSSLPSAISLGAGLLRAYPWKLDPARTYDTAYARVSATGSGELAVGVYADAGGSPGALLVDSGDLGVTAGMRSAAISFQPTVPDVWLGIRATASLSVLRTREPFQGPINLGTDDVVDGVISYGVERSGSVGAGALPDPFGTIASLLTNSADIPIILLKAGS